MGPFLKGTEQGEMLAGSKDSTNKEFGRGLIAQEIPEDIRRQRFLLKELYAAWKEEKFGPYEMRRHGSRSAFIMTSPEEAGAEDCEEIFSTGDDFTSGYSQLASIFLLCANAYPKHAPACYSLADSCFSMAKISSRLLSASWKLNHGFTLSLMRTGLKELQSPLNDLMLVLTHPLMWYMQLYSDLVEHVMTTNESLNEEFQKGYEHPPAESQISAFASMLGEAEAMLKEAFGQIRQLGGPKGDRPKQEEVSASSSARDESQGAEAEFEDAEMLERLRVVKDRIKSFVGDVRVFRGLLMNLKMSEC
jgi:hypothetical protein